MYSRQVIMLILLSIPEALEEALEEAKNWILICIFALTVGPYENNIKGFWSALSIFLKS